MWYQRLLLTATTQIPVCEMSSRWVVIGKFVRIMFLVIGLWFEYLIHYVLRTAGPIAKGWWWWSVGRATLCLVGYMNCNVYVCRIRCFANQGSGSVLSVTYDVWWADELEGIRDSLIKWGYKMLVAFLQQHDWKEWFLYIIFSKLNLKTVLLHGGNSNLQFQ
jgi:hypothetical protein